MNNIFLIIIINIFIIFIGSLSTQSIWLLIRNFYFDIPFSHKMISLGIIDSKLKNQLITVEWLSSFLMLIILSGLCVLGAFLTAPIGWIVYISTIVFFLLFLRPKREYYTWSDLNITKYAKRHSICMDMDKFNDYIDEIANQIVQSILDKKGIK